MVAAVVGQTQTSYIAGPMHGIACNEYRLGFNANVTPLRANQIVKCTEHLMNGIRHMDPRLLCQILNGPFSDWTSESGPQYLQKLKVAEFALERAEARRAPQSLQK